MNAPKKILLIEDDDATRHLFVHYLEGEPFEVFSASDGRQGLEMALAKKPDLIILDLMLPEMHGLGVCEAVKTNPSTKHAKVLIASVKGFSADRKQAAEAGADGFLTKPIGRVDFLTEIRNHLK